MTEDIAAMLKSGQNDLLWFDSNFNKLLEKYNEKFIAFRNREVIDANSDLNKLMNNLESKHIDTSNIIIKFISKVKFIL